MSVEDDERAAWERQRNWRFHRTLVEFLIQSRQPECAATLLEGSVEIVSSCRTDKPDVFYVDIPPAAYPLVGTSDEIQQVIRRAVKEVAKGNLRLEPRVELRMKLLPSPDERWEEEMKSHSTIQGVEPGPDFGLDGSKEREAASHLE